MKFASLAVLLTSTIAVQQPVVQQPVYVTAIEIVADVRDGNGEVPAGLEPSDFVVLEEGVEQEVIGVDYFASRGTIPEQGGSVLTPADDQTPRLNRQEEAGWQIVVFFDLYLSSATTIRSSVDSLLDRADELAALGQVSVVVSKPELEFITLDARSPDQIREAFRAVQSTGARGWLARHRRQYQARTDLGRGRPFLTDISVMAQAREQEEFVRSEILAEVDAVERFHAALLTAVGRFPRRTPRALFIVSEGFEVNTGAYYEQFARDLEDLRRIRTDPTEYNVGDTVDAVARFLASAGWTTIGIHASLGSGDQWLDDASRSSVGRASAPRAREALYASERGSDPLIAFAAETGGAAGTPGTIGSSVARLEQALIISYQVSRPPDGRPRSVEVKSRRPGLTIKAFRWATESTPSELAATRTLSLLSSSPIGGADLPTTVSLDWTGRIGPRRDGQITIRSSLREHVPLLGDRQTVFRVTVAITRKNAPPLIIHRTVTPKGSVDPFIIQIPIEAGDERLDVAATVEELTTGLWGGHRATM